MTTLPRSLAADAGETYVYCLATPTRADVNPRWAETISGDDLLYVLGLPLTTGSSATQRALSLLVMRYWINFIRSGCARQPSRSVLKTMVTTTIRLRFDGRSTAVRLFIEGH